MDLIWEWKRGKRRAAGMFPVSSLATGKWSFHSVKIKDIRKNKTLSISFIQQIVLIAYENYLFLQFVFI